jgi:hypothetical protein
LGEARWSIIVTDSDEIVRLAALRLKAVKSNLEGDVSMWAREAAQLDDADALMTFFAADLMEGKRFSVTISNPEIISLHRSLAQHIGASVEEIELGASTEMVFGPLAR